METNLTEGNTMTKIAKTFTLKVKLGDDYPAVLDNLRGRGQIRPTSSKEVINREMQRFFDDLISATVERLVATHAEALDAIAYREEIADHEAKAADGAASTRWLKEQAQKEKSGATASALQAGSEM